MWNTYVHKLATWINQSLVPSGLRDSQIVAIPCGSGPFGQRFGVGPSEVNPLIRFGQPGSIMTS